MSLQESIMVALKNAMKEKNQTALTALRAIKSSILLVRTETGSSVDLTEEQELKILQNLYLELKTAFLNLKMNKLKQKISL